MSISFDFHIPLILTTRDVMDIQSWVIILNMNAVPLKHSNAYKHSSKEIWCDRQIPLLDLLHVTITESLENCDSLGFEPRCSNLHVCRH